MLSNKSTILAITFLIEAVLAGAAVLWSLLYQIPLDLSNKENTLSSAIMGITLLILLNFATFNRFTLRAKLIAETFDFLKQFVVPLANAMTLPSAFFLACCAGIGEELFFRGMLEVEFGWGLSNLAFALIHFGRHSMKYPLLVGVYFLAGSILSATKWHGGGLLAPIISHVIFDFASLTYIKYRYPHHSESQ